MAMLVVRLVTLVYVFGATVSGDVTSSQLAQEANTKANDIANQLYGTLKNIAFPTGNAVSSGIIENRFLLLMPGKVLNYFDYFPGKEYTKFILVSYPHTRV